jgi:D-3-phosphoglycerate dehydrogenase / 2-oxoglutarate reductase
VFYIRSIKIVASFTGYGHIGSQLSVLAESMGMTVLYYDVLPIMPLGQAKQVTTLTELLSQSDFITLHVPESPDTERMISVNEFGAMKKGAYFINNSRGRVVDIDALVESLERGDLGGVAIDVFPQEPKNNGDAFDDNLNSFWSKLSKFPNVLLTPHIGGSTEEAQRMIGSEVSTFLIKYLNYGSTSGSVNFPEVSLRPILFEEARRIRLCYIHANVPGVLKTLNGILGDYNVDKQFSDSKGDLAYLLADIEIEEGVAGEEVTKEIFESVAKTGANVKTRILV